MQTKGQYRVGSSFNPSGDDAVSQIKAKAAELIDLIDTLEGTIKDYGSFREVTFDKRHQEVQRCKALAMTCIEDGAMWAVKAATKPAPEAS